MKGHIQKRGKQSYRLKFDIGKDANGNRLFDFVTVRGTRKDAEAELAKCLHEVNVGAYVESTKLTVTEFLDKWTTTYAEGNVAAKTLEGYKSIVENHFKPAFGSLPLQKLGPFQIQSYYSKAMKDGGRKDGRKGGVSSLTVNHMHRLLSETLDMAVRWQLLARNPCDAVTPPKVDPREVKAIDETAAAWLIEAAQGTRLYLPIFLATCAGLVAARSLERSGRMSMIASERCASIARFLRPKSRASS
jgi:hypothetical protein